jgi:hypothetical protein
MPEAELLIRLSVGAEEKGHAQQQHGYMMVWHGTKGCHVYL